MSKLERDLDNPGNNCINNNSYKYWNSSLDNHSRAELSKERSEKLVVPNSVKKMRHFVEEFHPNSTTPNSHLSSSVHSPTSVSSESPIEIKSEIPLQQSSHIGFDIYGALEMLSNGNVTEEPLPPIYNETGYLLDDGTVKQQESMIQANPLPEYDPNLGSLINYDVPCSLYGNYNYEEQVKIIIFFIIN